MDYDIDLTETLPSGRWRYSKRRWRELTNAVRALDLAAEGLWRDGNRSREAEALLDKLVRERHRLQLERERCYIALQRRQTGHGIVPHRNPLTTSG